MPFGLNQAPPPAPMTWKKGGGGEGKGEDAGVGVVDMPVIAPKGARRRGIATALLGERSPPPRQWDRGRDIASASPAADR